MGATTTAIVDEDGLPLSPLEEGGSVLLGQGEQHVGVVSERFFREGSGTLFRPANTTAYAALDALADSATASLVTPLSITLSRRREDPVTIERLSLFTTDTGLALGIRVRAFCFRAAPVAGAGDNAKFTLAIATAPANRSFIGSLTGAFIQNDSDASLVWSDAGFAILTPDSGSRLLFRPHDGKVYILLQALDAFTPSANSTSVTAVAEGFQGHA